jgi:hypothetical protein
MKHDTAWETELFVLRGDDREGLRRRIAELREELDRRPTVELTDLAFRPPRDPY